MPGSTVTFARSSIKFSAFALATFVSGLILVGPVFAQQAPPAAAPATPGAVAKPIKPAGAAEKKPAAKAEGGTPAVQGEAALRQRIENLEEQLVDMQVVVGTLESFAKSSGAASASPAYRAGSASAEPSSASGGVDQARVSGLEAQVRSLTTQVQQLSEQVRGQGGQPRRADAALSAPPPVNAGPGGPATSPAAAGAFGTATVTAAKADTIEGVLAAAPPGPGGESASASSQTAADGANPKQLYEAAYSYLLQQDYGAAETAFDDFLKRYPSDGLAGSAQFWLGESFFVRGQYKPAASAFLKGYQTYGRSSKAPDSLLKLAMSLGRLGQKDAACSSFGELNTRFPAASADVKSRAAAEKTRTGCP